MTFFFTNIIIIALILIIITIKVSVHLDNSDLISQPVLVDYFTLLPTSYVKPSVLREEVIFLLSFCQCSGYCGLNSPILRGRGGYPMGTTHCISSCTFRTL